MTCALLLEGGIVGETDFEPRQEMLLSVDDVGVLLGEQLLLVAEDGEKGEHLCVASDLEAFGNRREPSLVV